MATKDSISENSIVKFTYGDFEPIAKEILVLAEKTYEGKKEWFKKWEIKGITLNDEQRKQQGILYLASMIARNMDNPTLLQMELSIMHSGSSSQKS